MTDTPDDDIVLIEYGAVHRANGWFVQERAPGAVTHLEYGPMAESQVRPFIEQLKSSAMAIATDAKEKFEANLSTLMSADKPEKAN